MAHVSVGSVDFPLAPDGSVPESDPMEMRLSFSSPLGDLTVTETSGVISALDWGRNGAETSGSALLTEAQAQLEAYFAGRLMRFDLPISFTSTPLLHGVMEALFAIPYGHTLTYGEIAEYVESSAQSVGQACGANPVPIIIPCHRVLGASGLGGYSGEGGIETKVWLLRHEGAGGLLI